MEDFNSSLTAGNVKAAMKEVGSGGRGMKTVDDAIKCLNLLETMYGFEAETLRQFLDSLKAKAEPAALVDDAEGFILEHAAVMGFDHIDDDAEILAVSCRKLVDFVKLRQGGPGPKPREVKRHSDFSVLVVFNSCREASEFENKIKGH